MNELSYAKRGQAATEFMLYTTVFLFVVIAAFVVVNHVQSTEIPIRENEMARETGEGFAHVLTLAVKGGENFSYNYVFPKRLFSASNRIGTPYKIYFLTDDNHSMIMEWAGSYGDFSYSYRLPPYDYWYSADGHCLVEVGSPPVVYLNSSACSQINLRNQDGVLHISMG